MRNKNLPSWANVLEEAVIHPSVVFVPHKEKKTIIGKRVKIDSGSVIYGGVEIGNDCIIGQRAFRHNCDVFTTHSTR